MKICNETVHKAIDQELAHVQLTDLDKRAILAQCRPNVTVRRPRAPRWKRLAVTCAAAAVFAVSGLGVLAASPALADHLTMLSRNVQALLHPVGRVAEDNGIRMEVVAALNDRDVAAVYLTLQDVTGAGRITEDLELRNFEITGALFTGAHLLGYDEATGTAALCLTGEGGPLAGRPITVTLRSLLTGWDYQPGPSQPVNTLLEGLGLPAPEPDPAARIDTLAQGAGAPEAAPTILKDSGQRASLPGVPWAQVTAAGLVNGELHLQLLHDEAMGRFNRVDFYLTGPDGQPVDAGERIAELDEPMTLAPGWTFCRRQEHILTLPQGADPAQLRLHCGLSTFEACQEGEWSVGFRLQAPGQALVLPCPQQRQDWALETVEVSALGVTLRGRSPGGAAEDLPQVTVVQKDGTTAEFFSTSTYLDGSHVVQKLLFSVPLDLAQLGQVLLDDVPLALP